MANNVAEIRNTQIASLEEQQLMKVLKSSLYPGAEDESIKMVLAYCQAAKLDPMQKPVHIVPMWDSKSSSMRDVVMPGIGLYRIQAARGGEYAGIGEPEFGPDVTEKIGGVDITYPSWCKVIVKRRLLDGTIAEFAAIERWKENYAQKGGKEKSTAPNAMWQKRPYGQIAKCAEAQALRKAFPEIGSAPTADEMEGKEIDMGDAERVAERNVSGAPKPIPEYPREEFDKNFESWESAVLNKKRTADQIISMISTKGVLTDEQKQRIRNIGKEPKPKNEGITEAAAEFFGEE